jgi:hypothetical protein
MFRKNYTKWIPLGSYTFNGGVDTLVLVRKNIKTGMLQFKQKKINAFSSTSSLVCSIFPKDLIDVKKQWEIINNFPH